VPGCAGLPRGHVLRHAAGAGDAGAT